MAAEETYPFMLLVLWLQLTPNISQPCDFCKKNKTAFTCQHYIDVHTLWNVREEKRATLTPQEDQAIEHAWATAIQEQQAGRSTLYAETHHCFGCTLQIVEAWGGLQAVLTMLPVFKIPGASLVFCTSIKHPNQTRGGKTGILPTQSRTLEEVLRRLRENQVEEESLS